MSGTNDEELKSTPVMDEYMEFIFQKVIELYKYTVPDILARAFDIDIEEVESLTADYIKGKFDLDLRYQYVEPKETYTQSYAELKKKQKPYIKYIDNLNPNLLMSIALGKERYTPKSNVLLMQTRNKNVYDSQSIDELMSMSENFGDNEVVVSKIISDIDYVVHEMGHAFEHLINAKNPSYLYDFVMRDFKYSGEEQNIQSSIYDGEQFPISMEKIILEHLQQERTTGKVWIRQICNYSRCAKNVCCEKRKQT